MCRGWGDFFRMGLVRGYFGVCIFMLLGDFYSSFLFEMRCIDEKVGFIEG